MGCSNSTEKSPKARRKSRSPHEHPDSCGNPEIRITRSDSTSSSSSSSSSDSNKSKGSKKDKRNKKHRKKSKKDRKKSKDSSGECENQNPPVCENDPDDKPIVCVRRPEDRLPELELKVEKQEVPNETIACDLQPEPETNNTEETTPCKEDEAQPESARNEEGNDTKPESDTEAKPELEGDQ